MKNRKFWETKDNPITGYEVESLNSVVYLTEVPRRYKPNGDRYCKTYNPKKR